MFRFFGSPRRIIPTVIVTLAIALALPLSALANVSVQQISVDTYTNTTSQHKTQVESDTFAFGSTIVAVQQTGRFFDGGASNIAWATSANDGSTWTTGNLPGITKHDNPANPYNRVSDPAVAYDAKHGVWLVSTLAITEVSGGILGKAVLSSRSTTSSGTAWNNPVIVSAASGNSNLDKNWIACDNTVSSPFYGNCYSQWDDNGQSNKLYMSTSTDGGLTWGNKKATQGNYHGLGGQPVVMPNGTVCVPYWTGGTQIGAFRSTNGGGSWSSAVLVMNVTNHTVAGGLRSSALPSAEVDGAGRVFVVVQDASFRSGASSNDIVLSTSTNCTTWTSKVRVPIDTVTSGVDHFIPGVGVDKATSGSSAHVGITYYYYPVANCTFATCAVRVGYLSSSNGGTSWSAPTEIAGPMTLSWLPNTSQGPMVGDYTSTSYSASGLAHGAFAIAFAPTSGGPNCATATPNCDQATYTTAIGQALAVTNIAETPVELNRINMNAAEHANDNAPFTSR
jgi:hypothetical protein